MGEWLHRPTTFFGIQISGHWIHISIDMRFVLKKTELTSGCDVGDVFVWALPDTFLFSFGQEDNGRLPFLELKTRY